MADIIVCKCGGEKEISDFAVSPGKCQFCGSVGCWTSQDDKLNYVTNKMDKAHKALNFATKAILDCMGHRMTERDVKEILGEINRIQKS